MKVCYSGVIWKGCALGVYEFGCDVVGEHERVVSRQMGFGPFSTGFKTGFDLWCCYAPCGSNWQAQIVGFTTQPRLFGKVTWLFTPQLLRCSPPRLAVVSLRAFQPVGGSASSLRWSCHPLPQPTVPGRWSNAPAGVSPSAHGTVARRPLLPHQRTPFACLGAPRILLLLLLLLLPGDLLAARKTRAPPLAGARPVGRHRCCIITSALAPGLSSVRPLLDPWPVLASRLALSSRAPEQPIPTNRRR